MKVHVKILKGEDCTVDVVEQDKVLKIKEQVFKKLAVPLENQRLVHRGKPLMDDWTLKQCGVKDGTKLFLAIKNQDEATSSGDKTESKSQLNLWDELHYFLLKHYMPSDAKSIMAQFKKNFDASIDQLSLDDIERIATLSMTKEET